MATSKFRLGFTKFMFFRCTQKAPCHPCPSIEVELWCACDAVRSTPPPIVTTEPFTGFTGTDPIECFTYQDHM